MALSEAETRTQLIDPRLQIAGWGDELIQREYPYKKGRVRLIGEHTTRDAPLFADYVLRNAARGEILAVVEAKDESHGPSDGLGQALEYAVDLGVMFAYSSNGHGIVEHDRLTKAVTELHRFPTPLELGERLQAADSRRGPTVVNRRGDEVDNPIIEPAWRGATGTMRWYQERAVHSALLEILSGKDRALLSLATGTGKTFIAFNLCWKLIRSGYAHKVLFLADRVNLRDQAYNEFGGFGSARAIAGNGAVPLDHDIHFGIYQGLYAPHPDGGRLYEQYPKDYFDLVIIDECHRSGYGDWGAVLEYFSPAFHLGMTATPKRTDSIDTYRFFASENLGKGGEPEPAFQYSLGRGIEDGYLATYRVHQVVTNIDQDGLQIDEEIDRGADLVVPEDAIVRDVYLSPQFEREIVVKDRTKVLCQHLAGLLRNWGAHEKSIVFCVTMEHAAQVRDYMQAELGPETGKDLYAVRIVSEEHDGVALLEQFQLSSSKEPVLATTVDLLTTGVNAPSVRNIVFMKPVGSPTVFKQIIGRGSRLDESIGKEFFRIIDYTGATRLFDNWDIPPTGGNAELPTSGPGTLRVRVVSTPGGTAIEGASLTIRAGMRTLSELQTSREGTVVFLELPEGQLVLNTAANGHTRSVKKVPIEAGDQECTVELRVSTEGAGRVTINGVTVTISAETELTLGNGRQLSVTQYIDHAGEQIRSTAGSSVTLAELWRDPAKRKQLREALRSRDVDPAILTVLMARPDADEFDLLAHTGFSEPIHTREERARTVEHDEAELGKKYSAEQQLVMAALLDKYRLSGIEEIASAEVFSAPPFSAEFGGIGRLVDLFGGPGELAEMLKTLQFHIYCGAAS